jgi:hypothetical protein
MNTDLAGTLRAIGITDNDGFDFTLYASKMITALPRPVIITAGLRSTKAAHIGLLGFTDERQVVAEGSVCVLITDRVIGAFEYRQKPNEYRKVPGLVEREDDWWTLCAGYVFNDHFTVAGKVLDKTGNPIDAADVYLGRGVRRALASPLLAWKAVGSWQKGRSTAKPCSSR